MKQLKGKDRLLKLSTYLFIHIHGGYTQAYCTFKIYIKRCGRISYHTRTGGAYTVGCYVQTINKRNTLSVKKFSIIHLSNRGTIEQFVRSFDLYTGKNSNRDQMLICTIGVRIVCFYHKNDFEKNYRTFLKNYLRLYTTSIKKL